MVGEPLDDHHHGFLHRIAHHLADELTPATVALKLPHQL
jgi:hypothetical protein